MGWELSHPGPSVSRAQEFPTHTTPGMDSRFSLPGCRSNIPGEKLCARQIYQVPAIKVNPAEFVFYSFGWNLMKRWGDSNILPSAPQFVLRGPHSIYSQ